VESQALQLSATIQFGKPNVGSPFPPVPPHDQSAHAKDDMVPRTVVIDKGGTVTINTFGVHEVAIYDDGTEPEDIDTTDLVFMPAGCPNAPLLMNDDTNRLALYAQPCGGPRQVVHQFPDPGKYLVICAFLPHFEVQMYGWVIVRDR
jgi:plastocyanin